jgi:hypothetical protein
MKSLSRRGISASLVCLLLILPIGGLASAHIQDKPAHPAASSAVTSAPSAAEIAAAKSSGKVWVNLDSGIYHKAGRWYGKTKNGKFMTTEEARKAGYKPAKRD